MSKSQRLKKRQSLRKLAAGRRCGLCGATDNLTRTECCGNWICNDSHKYRLFSYERNSCYRNHSRYTLCGFHYAEGHEGDWKTCPKCRKEMESELEMYVWYGTNEYNYEKLPNPPAYEPTHCACCNRVIHLGTEEYMVSSEGYICSDCDTFDFGGGK